MWQQQSLGTPAASFCVTSSVCSKCTFTPRTSTDDNAMEMETLDGTEWDVVIADTGFASSLLAL